MDPFSLNLLGYIRQQEILETAAKARHDHRRWTWKISGFRLDMEQQGENDALSFSAPDLANGMSLRRWLMLWWLAFRPSITFAPRNQRRIQRRGQTAPRAAAITHPQTTVECVE